MKINKNNKIMITITIVILVSFWGILQVISMNNNSDPYLYSYFCDSNNSSEWNVVIYLDVNACISCTEDISAWKELENRLPEYKGQLTLWAPKKDSLDVAVAMELEGLKTPVKVIDKSTLQSLGWNNKATPIKILLDNNCQPKQTIGVMNSAEQSKIVIERLLKEVSSK